MKVVFAFKDRVNKYRYCSEQVCNCVCSRGKEGIPTNFGYVARHVHPGKSPLQCPNQPWTFFLCLLHVCEHAFFMLVLVLISSLNQAILTFTMSNQQSCHSDTETCKLFSSHPIVKRLLYGQSYSIREKALNLALNASTTTNSEKTTCFGLSVFSLKQNCRAPKELWFLTNIRERSD